MTVQFHEAPVASTLRVRMQWTNAGNPMGGSRWFFTYTKPSPTIAQCNAIASALLTNWNAQQLSLVPAGIKLSQVLVTDLDTVAGNIGSAGPSNAGTRAGSELPVSNCTVINWFVQTRYRGGKPKSFFPPGTASDTTDGRTWSSAFTTAYNTGISQMITAIAGAVSALNLIHVQVQYFKGHQPDPTPTTWGPVNVPLPLVPPQTNPILQFSTNSVIGTQRRRLHAGG